MLPHPLTSFEIKKKYYHDKPKFNGVSSRNDFPKIKNGTHVTSLNGYKSIEPHWIALYLNGFIITYFDRFESNIFQKKLNNSKATEISQQRFRI